VMTFIAFLASAGCTANVMLCSEEDGVMSTTLIRSRANSVNNRPENPDFPIIPLPVRLIIEMSGMDDIPLMGKFDYSASNSIRVPGNSGLKVLRIAMGIRFKNAGTIVGG